MIYKISPNPSFPKRGIDKSKKLPTRLREDPVKFYRRER